MKKRKGFRITQDDFLLANRKAAREEEIKAHGRQILFRSVKQRSRKHYDRKRDKSAGIHQEDD